MTHRVAALAAVLVWAAGPAALAGIDPALVGTWADEQGTVVAILRPDGTLTTDDGPGQWQADGTRYWHRLPSGQVRPWVYRVQGNDLWAENGEIGRIHLIRTAAAGGGMGADPGPPDAWGTPGGGWGRGAPQGYGGGPPAGGWGGAQGVPQGYGGGPSTGGWGGAQGQGGWGQGGPQGYGAAPGPGPARPPVGGATPVRGVPSMPAPEVGAEMENPPSPVPGRIGKDGRWSAPGGSLSFPVPAGWSVQYDESESRDVAFELPLGEGESSFASITRGPLEAGEEKLTIEELAARKLASFQESFPHLTAGALAVSRPPKGRPAATLEYSGKNPQTRQLVKVWAALVAGKKEYALVWVLGAVGKGFETRRQQIQGLLAGLRLAP